MSEPSARPAQLHAIPPEDEIVWLDEEPPDQEMSSDADQPTSPVRDGDGSLTDAVLAERISRELLEDAFCWASGLGWMRWDGKRWDRCDEVSVIEVVRQYVVEDVNRELPKVAQDWRARAALTSLLGRNRISAVTALARGIVEVRADAFDNHPDLLNTPTGIVDLPTGQLMKHDSAKLLTKITSVGYRPGARHPDWDAALKACPQDCHKWFQIKVGQGLTGYMTPDDTMTLLKGGGENGKSTVMGTLMEAAGSYHVLVSDRVLMSDPGAHPTELMDFRGARLAVAEELPEARRMSVKRLKDAVGTPRMKARYIRQDNVEWEATHSLFLSTNYLPVIEETDHGTWRRLQLLEFPFKFLKPHDQPSGAANELRGDPTLRQRLKEGREQRQAALAWAVEGARLWYANQRILPEPPKRVTEDTRKWRAESDLILGYWSERLVASPEHHVMSQELRDDFNAWLKSREQHQWSEKTFHSRFANHDETSRHRVEKQQMRLSPELSRAPASDSWSESLKPTPMRYAAWLGVRFRTAADDEEAGGEAKSGSNREAA